jgi:hypothetical protein
VSVPTPSIIVPPTATRAKPAADCSRSKVPLPPAETDGVRLDVSTDATRTSLLLRNTGSLSVIVVPDDQFASRLLAAPYANPADKASQAAMAAVGSSGSLTAVHEIPPYVPKTQIITVPPQWSVCALTDNVRETAGVRYLRDKASSADYFVVKALADELLTTFTPAQVRPALTKCAKSALTVMKERVDLEGIELYAAIFASGSACRLAYRPLFGKDERGSQRLSSAVLNTLERAPRLEENSELFEAVAPS